MTDNIEFEEIINSDIPVLVNFDATWCGICESLTPIINNIKKDLGETMPVVLIDVDIMKDLASKYDIRSLPTLAIFKNGKISWRESGLKEREALLEIIGQFVDLDLKKSDKNAKSRPKKTSWIKNLFGK